MQRHKNYGKTFLKEGLHQYNDSCSRYEFSKSSGRIYIRSLYFSKACYQIFKSILNQNYDVSIILSNDYYEDNIFHLNWSPCTL